jgi:hypothetical protein
MARTAAHSVSPLIRSWTLQEGCSDAAAKVAPLAQLPLYFWLEVLPESVDVLLLLLMPLQLVMLPLLRLLMAH